MLNYKIKMTSSPHTYFLYYSNINLLFNFIGHQRFLSLLVTNEKILPKYKKNEMDGIPYRIAII